MNIGRISYTNTAPYFHYWPSDGFTQVPGAPRELARMAGEGLIDAGPLPLVECWRLQNDFEYLGKWGIICRERAGSVFVLSRKPFAELAGATIGVTQDTSTSAMLAALLFKTRYQIDVKMKRGLDESDDAWLVIGDQALGARLNAPEERPFTVVTDLAAEWWNWHHKPFVFARWVVRKNVSVGDHTRLEWLISESLDKGLRNLPEVAGAAAFKVGLSGPVVERYLRDLVYELDTDAVASTHLFHTLLEEAGILKSLSLRGT